MLRKVKVPEERIPVIIGSKGETKKRIEDVTGAKITVDKDVTLEGDAISVLDAENITKAIGRGFAPEDAFKLSDEGTTLEIINIARNKDSLKRIRSRLIGTRGKARRRLEEITGTKIRIYGKTVSIIGKYENAALARDAVERLIGGSPHKFVYKHAEQRVKML